LQERFLLEEAWTEAAGPATAEHTQVGSYRRGVLEVIVDSAVLLQELAHFQKKLLLEQLRRKLPNTSFTDLRFRAGVVKKEA
jgi:predicted nucleic acid-binding Zn ribbon protein